MSAWWRRRSAGLLVLAGLGLVGRSAVRRAQPMDLQGQVAVVTGSSRGLGLLMARELGRQGARVVICARDEQELDEARSGLEGRGVDVLAVPCDVSDRDQVNRLAQKAMDRFGRVDILINNAGVIQVGPMVTMKIEDYEMALGTMYWGVVYPTLALLPQMVDRGTGRIVNITSIGGRISVPHLLPYSGAKFAAVGFSQGLRAEIAHTGVLVTTVVPGLMRTGSFLNALFKGNREQEYVWFTLGASLPLISVNPERAASLIIEATRRGDAVLEYPLITKVATRVHALFPALTADSLGLVDQLVLPDADGQETENVKGGEIQQQMGSKLFETVTGLGQSAAKRTNQ